MELGVIAEYYRLPAPSMRAAVWPLLGTPGFETNMVQYCKLSDDKLKSELARRVCGKIRDDYTRETGRDWRDAPLQGQMYEGAYRAGWGGGGIGPF